MNRVRVKVRAVVGLVLFLFIAGFIYYHIDPGQSASVVRPTNQQLPVHPRADPGGYPTTPALKVASRPHLKNISEWRPPNLPESLQNVDQTNQGLINHIYTEWLLPPFTGPRKLREPNREHYSQRTQSKYIDKLLKERTNGFFIEAGAGDGEYLSNSLFFEKSRGWSGLLVEANPTYFQDVLKLNRHAFMINTCLSPKTQPIMLEFKAVHVIGGLVGYMEDGHKRRVEREAPNYPSIRVQCLPLYSILKAANVTRVDYFSLDIEGAELDVLYTYPFESIPIDVLSVEYAVSGGGEATTEKLKKLTALLVDKHGYKKETDFKDTTEDVIFSKGV